MVKIDISNRTFILIGVLLVIVIFGGIVIAGNPAVFGHGLDQVNMPACAVGEALVKNSTGWGCGSVSSTGTLECVTGYAFENGAAGTLDKALYTSVRDNTYTYTNVFETTIVYSGVHGAPNMRCKQENGWILTGCNSAQADVEGNEQWLLNKNECRGEYGGGAWVSARCCKII